MYNNKPVKLTPKDMKSMARTMLKGHYWEGLIMLLIITVITEAPSILLSRFSSSAILDAVLMVYDILISGIISVSCCAYFIAIFRGRAKGGDYRLFESCNYMESIRLYVIVQLRIFIKTLLLIIPGIIEGIRLSQVYVIMADDPTKSAQQCVRESTEMMRGNEWSYVILELSFLGYLVLAALPGTIFQQYMLGDITSYGSLENAINAISALSMHPVTILLSLLTLFVQVYMLTTQICFYDLLSGKIIFEEEDDSYDAGIPEMIR